MIASLQTIFFIALLMVNIIPAAYADETGRMDYSIYQTLLSQYVDDDGLVDYQGLQEDQDRFETFLQEMSTVTKQEYEQWKEADQTAYWINAYNAFTLKAILDHYPIKAGWLTSLTYPKNSIRHISGVWDTLKFNAMGKPLTLDEIEHKILRVQFNEPRIHVAIVCASIGCPTLRNEPFTGAQLEEQLVDQTKRFLSNPQNFRIDKENHTVYLSSIFSWFGEDFINKHGNTPNYQHLNKTEHAIISFISNYISDEDQYYLLKNKFSISYTKYDWALNEQP